MKKSTFIDYNVILAAMSHRKKKNKVNAEKQRSSILEVSHSNVGPEKDKARKITIYSKELVA